ncbi:MAG: TIGR03643 family protein [Pseudomonadota bacterium]
MTNTTYNIGEVIDMAWCDKTSFDDIYAITGLREADVIRLMRQNLKVGSFKIWRQRVTGRKAKHKKLSK